MKHTFLIWLAILACIGLVLFAVRVRRRARGPQRRPSGAGAFGWALLFLTSGRMPPPPPETQIEEETRGEKDRGSSQPLRRPPDSRQT
jgi:hypothetical protein